MDWESKDVCKYCRNTGIVIYHEVISGTRYSFAARCICSQGYDLKKFSKPQIDRNCLILDKNGDRTVDNTVYIPNIRDVYKENFTQIFG